MARPDLVATVRNDLVITCRHADCAWRIRGAMPDGAGVVAGYLLHCLTHRLIPPTHQGETHVPTPPDVSFT